MKAARDFTIVFVTAPDLETARTIVHTVLEQQLAACGNIIPKLESHYWWQGKIEQNAEALILFKTRASSLEALESVVAANHPYDTPEIISTTLESSSERYLAWLETNIARQRTI